MKRIIYYLFFLISPFTSCVMDDLSIKSTLMWDDDFDLAPRIPSEATELEVPFIFGTSADWNVVISDPLTKSHSWCSTPQDNGTRSYEITLHLIFEPNDTAEDRVVNVTVKTLFDSVLLVVTQSGSDDALTPEGQSITYNDSFALFQSVFADSKVLTPEFVFNATESWSVECESEGDWISVSNASGEKGDLITLGVNFEENINEDEEGREGTITISTSKDEVMLTIKQHAKGVSIIPPLDFALAQTVEGSATSLDPPFVFSVQEAWTVLVTTDVDGDIDAKDTGAGDEQWLSVDQMEGEAGYNIPLAITFDANTTDPREGRVTITTDGGSSVELTIIQLGETIEITYPDGFELTQTVLSSAMSLTPSFSFSVQEAWTVAVTPAGAEQWLTADKMEGEAGDNIPLAITFEANATDVEREGTVTITANSGHSVTLEITQEGEIREIEFSYDEDFELTQTIAYNTLALDPEFVFNSPDAWQTTATTTDATGDVSWVTVAGFGGDGINIKLPITFEENETYFDRTVKIILDTYGDVPNIVEFNISQEAFPVAEFTYDAVFGQPQTVAYDDTTIDPAFEFSVNDSWTATVSGDNSSWLTIDGSSSVNDEIATDYTLPITFEANTTYEDRTATITLSFTDPRVDDLVFTVTQQLNPTIAIITVSTPQESSTIEGFRKNTEDVKAYDGDPGGHDPSSGGGGYIIHNFQGKKTVYIPYNITLSNSEDYTWKATSSFNIEDAGLVSSVDYIDDDNTAKAKEVTGDDGQGVYLFVDVTGPGDKAIVGTLTIETVLKNENNPNKEVYKKIFNLNIITSCGVGETTTANLVWDDRNIGMSVPSKAEEPVAQYYANVQGGGFVGDVRYKGDYIGWSESLTVCPAGWRTPTKNEFDRLLSTDLRFSKSRAFVVSDAKSNLFLYDYTGAWFPLAGWDAASYYVDGTYWSSTEEDSSVAYRLNFTPTNGYSYFSRKTTGFSVRCVKDIAP